MGRDKQIESIYVQNPEKLPKDLRKKGKYLNLTTMENNLDENSKNKIINLFIDSISKDIISSRKRKNCLIITQPIEKANFPEERKKELYRQISLKMSNDGFEVFLKPHPKEKTDYSFLEIENIHLLNKDFPLEITNLFDKTCFDLGITLYSASLKNINIPKKIHLGEKSLKAFIRTNNIEEKIPSEIYKDI